MARVIAEAGAGAILMHMRGLDPRTMQDDVSYAHPLADVATFLSQAAERAAAAGIPAEAIAVDPGLGFGKSPEGNLLLLRHLAAFASLGCAIAVGASRKAFVRRFSGLPENASPADRLPGSLAALSAAAAARRAHPARPRRPRVGPLSAHGRSDRARAARRPETGRSRGPLMQTFAHRFAALGHLNFTWRDALDIVVVAVITYALLRLIRGTRAVQMVIGLFAVFAVYAVASLLNLVALHDDSEGADLLRAVRDHRPVLPRAAPGPGGLRAHAVLRALLRAFTPRRRSPRSSSR